MKGFLITLLIIKIFLGSVVGGYYLRDYLDDHPDNFLNDVREWLLDVLNLEEEESEEDFRERVADVLEKNDEKEVEKLFYWEGVNPETRVVMEELIIKPLASSDVQKVAFSDEESESSLEIDGKSYKANVTVKGVIEIEYKYQEDDIEIKNTQYLEYGKKDKKYYFAGYSTEDDQEETEETANILNVNVQATTVPQPVSFKGECLYQKGGQEHKEEFESDQGYVSKAFQGDYITSCEVRKISNHGYIKLVIYENGKEVFASDKVTDQDSIIYRRGDHSASEEQAQIVTNLEIEIKNHEKYNQKELDFIQKIVTALEKSDKEAVLESFYWQGVNDTAKTFQTDQINRIFSGEILKISLAPASGDYSLSLSGQTYKANLVLIGLISIEIKSDAGSTTEVLYYGLKNEVYYFMGLVKEKELG